MEKNDKPCLYRRCEGYIHRVMSVSSPRWWRKTATRQSASISKTGDKAKVIVAKGKTCGYELQPIKRLLLEEYHFKGGGSTTFMEFGGAKDDTLEAALKQLVEA